MLRAGFVSMISAAVGFLIIAYVLFNLDSTAKIAGLAWLAVGVATLGFYKPASSG